MIKFFFRVFFSVLIGITTALIFQFLGATDFTQGLWAGTLATIANRLIYDYVENNYN